MQFRSIKSHWNPEYHNRGYPNINQPIDMIYRLSDTKDKKSSIVESSSENSESGSDVANESDVDNESGSDVAANQQPTIIDMFDQVAETKI